VEKLIIHSDVRAARSIGETILAKADHCGYSKEAAFAIRLALEEALVNAMKHGNGGDPRKKITVEYSIDRHRAVIAITDEGPGFNFAGVPDPTADENLECPSGRGIMLMRAYMDEVKYASGGRTVRMSKRNI
jgi:serine/threonine-protein kinase RsbW